MNRRKHSNEFKMEAVRLAERREVPVSQVARELGICESLLHKWIKQFGKSVDGVRVSADEHEELIRLRREIEDARLIDKIRGIYDASNGVYGVRRVHRQLIADGERCSVSRVARLMRKCGIKARRKRKFRVTTDSKHNLPVAENLLDREFFSAGPNQVWASEITYIWTVEGWLYLAAVLDALSMATGRRNPKPGLIDHSDRGSQYASFDYRRALEKHDMRCSMSRKGDCRDNAVAESFFSTLKTERVHHRLYRSRAEARRDIFEYIEVFYNRVRLHSTLGYLSPAQFESRTLAKAA